MESFPELQDLILVKANREQHVQSWRNHKVEWGKQIPSVDRYIHRETTIANSNFSKRGLTVWCLVPKDDIETLNFVCSCETYLRPALISEPSSEDGNERKVREVQVRSIASVFCPEKFRRRGYAALMMKKLGDALNELKEPASFLYSDIGPKFYSESCKSSEGRGWNVRDPFEVLLESPHFFPHFEEVSREIQMEDSVSLKQSDFEWVSELDVKLLKEFDLKDPKDGKSTLISVVPDAETHQWHLARSLDEIDDFKDADPSSWTHGCSVGKKGEQKDWAFAVWTPHFKTDTLEILRLRLSGNEARRTKELQFLFTKAIEEAKKIGLKKVMAWNVPKDAAQGMNVGSMERSDELPSVAWYGDQAEGENLVWKFNEKFAWV
eukprot:TRINITY_DN6160_c0_g1_i1.p1 TRINITY_DN6160_c0_g1~~TRINITY_DN6160_c0_g1_i1.p1  ORF type:complete len:379 (-),score=117.05 TRINITY_DN6160_c0_g1_i1:120-1256(-)